jgi:hypothetical protein
MVTAPRALRAQISPGPLARPHASLDVPLGCAKCHGGRKEPTTQRCLSCHREISSLKQQERGYHAQGKAATGTCASCHPDHAGRDFELIKWPDGSPERFDHGTTGWLLEGKHQDVTCAKCHKASFRVDASAALSPREGGPKWAGLEQRCASCHDDPHRPTLGAKCTSCHDMAGWKPAPSFDHQKTKYPLTGEHKDVECADCHLAPRLNPRRGKDGHLVPVFKPVPAGSCANCHDDPHKTAAMTKCSSCHTTSGFRDIKRGAFAHDRTRFPLTGEHRGVPCASCHAGYPRTINRPAFNTCATCHADPHRGQATLAGRVVDCAACHDVEGFIPGRFTISQHQATKYPLVGRHITARCSDCHRPRAIAPARPGAGARAVADLRPAFSSCTSCHVDPHRSDAGKRAGDARAAGGITDGACESCHNLNGFRPSTLDVTAHARFAYALEGAHRTVPCAECHRELRSPERRGLSTLLHLASRRRNLPPLTMKAPTSCASCHTTPHGNQFASRRDGGACESCHTLNTFRPAERFDHDRDTKFRLTPAHTNVPCTSCHVRPKPSDPVAYRGTVVRCEQCHSGGKR